MRTVVMIALVVLVACMHRTQGGVASGGGAPTGAAMMMVGAGAPDASSYGREVQQGYTRVRAATEKFRQLDAAVAAGYSGTIPECFVDSLHTPPHGAMGYHHVNRGYVDASVDVEKPEILLYERKASGSYALNGVEYLLPYRFWPRDSVPPGLLGREMFRDDERSYWYTHMWVWTRNSAGLFADWNPAVRCPDKK